MKKVKQILSLFLCISVLISGFIPVYAEAPQKATKDENVFLILKNMHLIILLKICLKMQKINLLLIFQN